MNITPPPANTLVDTVTTLVAQSNNIKQEEKRVFAQSAFDTTINLRELPLDSVATFGKFPYRPSDTFLTIYAAVLEAIQKNPETGVISPALIGTSGVVPLTVLSTIPDIMQHYHNTIKNAQYEVLLATNAWEPSLSCEHVTLAIRELNERAGVQGRKVVVKILVDTITLRNTFHDRFVYKPEEYEKLGLPQIEEIPNIDLEIVNYHKSPLGTFHGKFLIVDRTVALVNSNNVNMRSNMELMCHFEGDVVNSLYDTFLISWREPMSHSRLPCIDTPAQEPLWNHIQEPKHISLAERFNTGEEAKSTCEDDGKFVPYFFHRKHDPVPMAIVNRRAYASPGHSDLLTPQNAAWLAALQNAKREVFIQSPVFNAKPIVKAVIEACKRDIIVTLFVNIGFNDFSEGMVPFQGGTNEHVARKMMKKLQAVNKDQNLHYYWYIAKDQDVPIQFQQSARNCHVKFMQVDGEVGIMGSGNMDTQSWFHSEEVNVMIDSKQIVQEWMSLMSNNQNTLKYGRIDCHGKLVSGEKIPPKSHGLHLSRSKGGFL
jgi:phosphatidylserine/phosphatidylglycerophosphate/cardiolipin synthase-like enzyme